MTADTTPESPEYTPTTEEVRIKYKLASGRGPETLDEFDRWLAAHHAAVMRRVGAAVWDAAVASLRYEDGSPVWVVASLNPYRAATPTEEGKHRRNEESK